MIKKVIWCGKSILFWRNDNVYSDNSLPEKLPTDFVNVFVDKIVKINTSISESVINEITCEIN